MADIKEKLIVALDVSNIEQAEVLIDTLAPYVGAFKIGMQLFYSEGHRVIALATSRGSQVFLDLKMHDIPHTVARASEALVLPGVFMFNVHAAGGLEMMRQAANSTREQAKDVGLPKPILLGVTVLTSMDEAGLKDINVAIPPAEQVVHLARLAQQAGLDGVVASPQEIVKIRQACGPHFVIVTPGIRPMGGDVNDQKRTATPLNAVKAGADYIIVGRPITGAADPAKAAREMLAEMGEAHVD
jgi:orotidine-5'-phosphate decarboxylase